MNRILGLASILGALSADGPVPPTVPLRVAARVTTPGPHFVGQAIELRVEVEGDSPEVSAPRPAAAEIQRLATVGSGPSAARFVVVPRQPGTLVIHPFRARSGDRTGASRPTRLAIENVPPVGRSAAFLGGVGPFGVATEADPTRLRLGDSLEYRLRLTGPAAWGSDRPPELGGWSSLAAGFRVEPLPGRLDPVDPATRTFRYRLRPTRAGRWVLPPVTVAAFDPTTRSYPTKVAPGVPIEVVGPPPFDPAELDYGGDRRAADGSDRRAWWILGLGVGGAAGSAGAARLWLRRARSPARPGPRRLAGELARGLAEGVDQAETARQVAGALAEFLRVIGGRPPGVLTPPEARVEVERLTLDGDLADRAGRLVEACDRARFGGRGEEAGRLLGLGREFLELLGGATEGRTEGGSRGRSG